MLLAVVAPTAPRAAGPTPPARTSVARALADTNADGVLDGLGRPVAIVGRASVASGQLGGDASFFVQDATGGVRVDARPGGPAVLPGDSVVVSGRLTSRNGLAVVEDADVRVVAGPRRPPVPLAYDSRAPERVEGRLVAVEAVVSGLNPVPAGDALLLSLPDGALLVAFVFRDRAQPIPLQGYAPGDHIRIVGVAGQYDREAPFRDSYQIYPRTADDLVRADIPASMYRRGALTALGGLTLVLVWALALRGEVARRVAQLRTSEARYRVLVERASDAVLVHDLDGEVFEVNEAARRAFGIYAGDPVPRRMPVAPADRDEERAHLAALGAAGRARTDLRVIRPDGTEVVLEVDSQTVDLDGRRLALSLARDVGARRAHERGLVEAREAAEEALRVKTAFLANMSHEIRTPLTAVLGYAELLAEEVAVEQRDLVAAIEGGGRRLLATLNSVLDLARLDAGRETLRPVQMDLAAYVGESVALFGGLAAAKGLRLDFRPEADTLAACLDAGALDRVLANLVGNAIKFTDVGGVSVGLVREPAQAGADGAVLTVIDTGVGMSEAFLPDVFAEFRQASEGHARSHEGTGLGLSITRKLVGLMGGTIAVESALGRGTTVTVRLPLGDVPTNGEASPGDARQVPAREFALA